ncbi:helix-turn-helix domain-containing protein [Konateibacter massiliensis]|uniref:helix-turn-helix domain-containing protein n=1 Tax=Konateibacter massiliensis TaxID=2002841 RepID=UPI000C155D28|nr:AraC family transcriptional regulator [Konateibacter massiliensis]
MALVPCNTKINTQGRELTAHGTAFFPIGCYEDSLSSQNVPWHWHDEWEAAIVAKGSVTIKAGSETYILQKGNGIFINSGILHSAQNTTTDDCQLRSVVFHPRLIGGSIDSVFWHNYVQPVLTDVSLKSIAFYQANSLHAEALTSIERAWEFCKEEKRGYEFQVREALSTLIYFLVEHHSTVQNRPSEKSFRDAKRIKAMLQFIQTYYYEEISVTDISQSSMISVSECLRCFRSTIGVTPFQYVKQFRIQKATELLISTDQKIVEIGALCGFQEMSYFAKTFKEMHGCTPSEYRKMYAKL